MKSSENTFAALLSIEGNQWHYHIPRFQREYVWGRYNWSKLLEDIYANDPGHYMGSIICVHKEDELTPGNELIYEVVDGQQRLMTLSLLLAAIYKKLGKIAKSDPSARENEEFIIKRNGIKKRLIKEINITHHELPSGAFRSGSLVYCLRVQPSTQENNLEDYKYILNEICLLPEGTCPKYTRIRRIYRAFDYFSCHIPDELPDLYDLLDRISSLYFIHITEASQSKAFMLFETLNYRGVPLSAIDIIKNKMLATLESKHICPIDEAYDKWQKILEKLPEEVDQDRFLRQYYNAFKFDPKIKIEKITRATSSNIISIYESLIKRNAGFIFEELIAKAKIYNQFLEPNRCSSLIELERIGAAPSYIFLLYLFALPEDAFVDENIKERTVELLCRYYFRRNITDYPNTRDLDRINIDLIERCQQELQEGRKLNYAFISHSILTGKGQPSTFEQLKEALADNLFYNNESMARYALVRLDETSHTREYAPNLRARNEKGLYVWTVEHIFPRSGKVSDWSEVVASSDELEQITAEYLHCLGNLTLSGYNSRLSNQSFPKKQAKSEASIFGMPINIGYRNGLALNNIPFTVGGKPVTLAAADRWTIEHIKARNSVMVDMLIELFKLDGE